MTRILPLLVLSLLSPHAFAGKKPKKPKKGAEPVAAAAPAGPAVNLWRIEKAGQPASYLFGTCHQGVDLAQALPAEHEPLVTGAHQLITETALGSMFQPHVMAMFLLPEGQSLRAMVGEESWASLAAALGGEAAATGFERLHPAIASVALAQQLIQPEVDGTPALGIMDISLTSLAQRSGVPNRHLETAEEQVTALLSGDLDTHVEGLKAVLDPAEREKLMAQTNAVLGACRTGEHGPAIETIQQTPAAWREVMFDARNEAWVPKLEAYFADGASFAAVGVGHLIGARNVIELLEARGYTATRLSGATAPGRDPHAPVTLAEWLTVMRDQLPTMLCGGSAVSDCLDAPMATCREAFAAGVDACATMMPLPDPVPMAQGAQMGAGIGQCATLQGIQALQAHVLDTPTCQALAPR